ncbi:MAG: GNAT family N-acetyltransferase [Oscillospiraceae bacterium]|nr:GNAT family N-acetyltransferase [Oscillospiraceae bacterium]
MEIRFADTRDIPGMIRLLQQVGEVHHRIRPDLFRSGAQKYDEAALEALLRDPDRPILAAVEGERLLGYCFCILETLRGDPVLTDGRTLYIDDLCVDEACRGKHIGQALYDRACGYARELGCRSVTLNVWCGNDSAMAFYEKQGMKPRKIYMETTL